MLTQSSTTIAPGTQQFSIEYVVSPEVRHPDDRQCSDVQTRAQHWDRVAQQLPQRRGPAEHYQRRLAEIYSFLVAPGQRVLEIGCGRGDLLAALKPSVGVGIDLSGVMIEQGRTTHPELHFIQGDAHQIALNQVFDAIILSDLINDVWDVQTVLEQIRPLCHARTRLIINVYSRVWELPLKVGEHFGLANPNRVQNWLTPDDVTGLLHLSGFDVIRSWEEVLAPLPAGPLERLCNRVLVKLKPFSALALTNIMIARPHTRAASDKTPSVTVLVPARNEAGNIAAIFDRTPELGAGTELIFVEGHSKDDTYSVIEQEIAARPERNARLLRQPGKGKGDAVRTGFAAAQGDILMILDADLTMPPEDLPRYYTALVTNKAEFVNGVRLVYPMDQEAMRFLNLLGNKFFSLAFSWLLGQPIKDTLCGTKVLWRKDYEQIAANRSYFGDFDPFGDFDLLFGAARLGLKIMDLPIRYRERTYGTTNIQRWRHGLLLLRMVRFAAGRIKFI